MRRATAALAQLARLSGGRCVGGLQGALQPAGWLSMGSCNGFGVAQRPERRRGGYRGSREPLAPCPVKVLPLLVPLRPGAPSKTGLFRCSLSLLIPRALGSAAWASPGPVWPRETTLHKGPRAAERRR